jgi:hypothetical protein
MERIRPSEAGASGSATTPRHRRPAVPGRALRPDDFAGHVSSNGFVRCDAEWARDLYNEPIRRPTGPNNFVAPY